MKFDLRAKLLGGMAVMLLMILVVGSINMYLSNRSQGLLRTIMERDARSVEIITDLLRRAAFVHSNCLLHLLLPSVDDMHRYESEIDDWEGKISHDFETLKGILKDQATLDRLWAAEASWKKYVKVWNEQVKPLSMENLDEEAFALLRKKGTAGAAVRDAMYGLNELYDRLVEKVASQVESAEQDFKKNKLTLLATILVAIIFGLIFGVRFSTRIAGAVNTVAGAAERMANGDFDQEVEVRTGDEIGSMADSFNLMAVKLKELMEAEQKASEQMREEIAARKQAQEELERLNESLEEEVAERTRDFRQSNEMLMESENKYKGLVEMLPVGVALSTPGAEGTVIDINQAQWRMFGYDSKEEFLKLPASAHYHDADERERFSRLRERGPVKGHTLRLKRKDGSLFWGSVNSVTKVAEDGTIQFINVVEDVTELKQAQEALRKIADEQSVLLSTVPVMIFWVDNRGTFIRVNGSFAAALHKSPDDISGRSLFDLYPEDMARRFHNDNVEIMKSGTPKKHIEESVETPIGTIWVSTDKIPYRDEKGDIIGVIGFSQDISESKMTVEALKESEKRFRTVADFTYDWESWIGPDGKYTFVSPSCERITGYPAEEFMKDPDLFTRIVHPDDRESVSMHMKDHKDMEGARDNHIDFRIITREDDTRWISHYCLPVYDEDENWLGMRASNRDITDRIKLEQQLVQSQKMEAIGRLAGGIAHDFNNLLTTIIGYADIMLMKVDEASPLRNGLEEIKRASDRAANLTSQLLAFSRKQIIHPVVLNLNYPLAEMDKMLRRLIGENIDLITILEPELWEVKFDPGQMDQVVMNLVVNAKDAMPGGGKLTIETANVDLDETYARQHGVALKPGLFVMVAVSDTGMGIKEEIQADIFDPFFTTKEKGKGTGLGLSMVYGIVKQSGGFIWVYSEPGRGTTFKIYLPKSEAEEEFRGKEQVEPQNLEGSETILLAEDDDSARKLIRSILQEYGYLILEAQDGEEALRLGEQHESPIHLLLTDVVMPGMDGRELAERLQPLQPEMKVLYMSGYTDNAIAHNGVLESGTLFIQKPFTPEALASKCRKALDG